jgi:hypothetical protein
MKHIKTFENFLNEDILNEAKDFGDMSDAIGGGNDNEFKKFFKSVKKGDTFNYAPNGVELDYLTDNGDLNNDEIELGASMIGRDATPAKCTVVLKKKVALTGGSFELEGDTEEAIFYTMEGTPTIFVLTNTFG